MASNNLGVGMGGSMQHLSVTDAIYALSDIIDAYQSPSHVALVENFRKEHGGNMIKRMQIVYPAAINLQAQVISKYGFTPDGEGVVQFTQTVKMLEKQDPEVARLSQLVRQHLLPPSSGAMPSNNGDQYSSGNMSNLYNNQPNNLNHERYQLSNNTYADPYGRTYAGNRPH